MKKILVLSWFFPPVNSSEGLVTYKLLKYSNYDYVVFSQKGNDLWSYGKNDYLPETNNIKCVYSKTNSLNEWKKEAIEYYKNNKDKYDIIMTRSMPEESLEVGLSIKKINPNIIWIASFGDPVANNPFTLQALCQENPYSFKNKYMVNKNFCEIISPKRIIKKNIWKYRYKKQNRQYYKNKQKLEENTIKIADKIICNNNFQKDYMFKNYQDELSKVICIPHSYDEELYPKTTKNNSKLKFTYIGHLDDIRSPKLLIYAVSKLKNKFPDLKNRVLFEFYGNISDSDKVRIIDYDLTDVIKIKKGITYIESLKKMEESDWLLHFDANISSVVDDNIFFAAKLADYFGSKTNIMSVTMINGASADILRSINSLIVSHDVDEIYNYLYLIIYKKYTINQNIEIIKKYNAKNVANILDEEIKKYADKNNKKNIF